MKALVLMVLLLPVSAYAFEWGDLLSPSFYEPYLLYVVLAVEFVLGKTDWVKSGSIIELILNGLLKVVKKESKV